MNKATLLFIQGIEQGARFEIGEEEVGLGRGVQNPIRIHDTEVSRTHARLNFVNGVYRLTDQNSSNGTYVNGQPIRERDLVSGDQIQIGRAVMLFTQAAEEDDSQVAADHIALLGTHDPEDRASIVGEASQQDADSVVNLTQKGGNLDAAQTVANLQVLYRISEEAVRPSLSLDQLLSRILELAIDVARADRGCMLLRDSQSGDLVPQVFSHRRGVPAIGTSRMPVSRSIVDYVLQNRQGVSTSDARTDRRFAPGQSILQAGIREAICVPMQGRYDLMGVIYIDITTPPERVILDGPAAGKFSEEMLRLMVAVGRQSAVAIEDNRYQQALVKAERLAAVGQTITILSHHIKNILQGVRGGSYLIDMGLKDHNEDLMRKGWTIVEKNQNKIYNLVMDMLTFSKERQPSLKRGSLNETVEEVYELMQARAAELNVRLECRLDPDLPPTCFDAEGIHRAVLNIVTNALDAVESVEQGCVQLVTGQDSESRTEFVTVSDNGPGIPPEIMPHIFNLFESTKGARGTGIGLAVSQKIIREHGGEISVSNEPGAGACFTLAWPIIDDDQLPEESQTIG